MARLPERKTEDATFRCLDEDGFLFKAPMEYVALDAGEEEGHRVIEWEPEHPPRNMPPVECPHDPTHSIELVKE